MLVLGVETSTRTGSIALMRDGHLVAEQPLPDEGRRHAQTIVSTAAEILRQAGLKANSCDRIAVSVGPGSFTGLRVGVVFAKTYSWMTGCGLAGVRTSDAIAEGVELSAELWTLIDAQRGDIYATLYNRNPTNGRWTKSRETRLMSFESWLAGTSSGQAVSGPVLGRYAERISDQLIVAPDSNWIPTARCVAQLAFGDDSDMNMAECFSLVPYYIRRSSAEEKWDDLQNADSHAAGSD